MADEFKDALRADVELPVTAQTVYALRQRILTLEGEVALWRERAEAARQRLVEIAKDLPAQPLGGYREFEERMGKSDWSYDDELDMHIPCCSRWVPGKVPGGRKCGNGPLTGDRELAGDCGEHGEPDEPPVEP